MAFEQKCEPERPAFWEDYFHDDRDPYVQMLNKANCPSVFSDPVRTRLS